MRILVTGGAGFIGANFIKHILNKYEDYSIVNLDKLTYAGNLRNLEDIQNDKRYSFVKGDICDRVIVEKSMNGCDIVVNFAAETHVDRSIITPDEFLRTNILGTHTLLKSAKKYSIKRFIQISTDEIYGSIENGSFTEESKITPRNPYSASKAGADMLTLSFYHTYNLPIIITRSSNNFGGYQHPEKLIPLFITNLLDGKKVPLYGDGRNIRDWTYVLDNCSAIDIVIHKGCVGEIYNISSGNEMQNIEITKLILKKLSKDELSIQYVPDRIGHDRRYSIESRKIRRLGWKPEHEFEEALDKTIEWYKENIHWWKELKDK